MVQLHRYFVYYEFFINGNAYKGNFVYSNSLPYLNDSSLKYIESYALNNVIIPKFGLKPDYLIINSISFIGKSTDEEFNK